MRALTYILPTLLALWFVDTQISRDRTVGWERNSVINSMKRWDRRPQAKVAILGSSTSKDWLHSGMLAQVMGVSAGDVLDAHVNGCHQDCTFAEVRQLRARSKKGNFEFQAAFFGTNLFQMCEFPHTKRVLQQEMMLPSADIPRLFGIYWAGQQPLQSIGRFAGMKLSGAYGDTAYVRGEAAKGVFGKPKRGQGHRWARARVERDKSVLSCSYEPAAIALKRRYTEQVLDDLKDISEHVYLMLLPDKSLDAPDAEMKARWAAHIALHREIADARPWVTLVDLVEGGVHDRREFRDDIHLNKAGVRAQQALFKKRMKVLRAKPQ